MKRLLLTLIMMLCAASAVLSQAQMSSGDIKGTMKDPTDAVVPGVTITVTNVDTGVERRTVTDSLGNYRFLVLSPGTYELKSEMAGFAMYTRRPIQVTVGESVIIDAQLQPAGIQQEVVVQAEAPLLETAKVQQADTITNERIDNLPINERNFLNFSLLTPGVTDAKGLVAFSLPQTSTSDLSFLGQNGRSNSVTIDGVDNNDNAVAAVRSTLSQEAVQEFQINRSNFSAEFGRAAGGLINIVSKSGGNAWHGNILAFWRDQALDARNPFAFGPANSPIDPPYSRQQAGFTLGGPLKRDKSFFFLSYEGLRQRESRFVSFMENTKFFQPTPLQEALIAELAASPVPQFRVFAPQVRGALTTAEQTYPDTVRLLRSQSGVFPYRNNDNKASFRLDHSASATDQMFGRLTFGDEDTAGGALGGLRGPSRGANYKIQDWSAVYGDTHFFSPKAVNEFRYQFARRYYGVLPADPFGPEVSINGVALLGRDFFLPSTRTEKRYQLVDNFTFVTGRHELKFGGDFHYLPFDTVTEVFLGGRFIFGEAIPLSLVLDSFAGAGTSQSASPFLSPTGRAALATPVTSLQAFNFGLPIVYQQGFGDPKASLTNKLFAGYIQDNYRPTPYLVLNLGLRYDQEMQPTPLNRDKNNWAPRIGFSYTATPRTVVRGGYGVYYAMLFEAVAFVQRVLDGTQISQVFVPAPNSFQVWGLAKQLDTIGKRVLTTADIGRLGLRPGVTPPVLLSTDPGIVNPYSQQFSLGIDREISNNINLSVNYIGNRGAKVIRSRNTNLQQAGFSPYGPGYGPAFARVDPRVLQNSQVEASGSSIYHGLAVSAIKRYSNNYQFQVSYTWSKAIDDTTDFITDLQPANQLNLRAERGLSSWDQRHRLVVSGVVKSPFDQSTGLGKVLQGMTLSPIVTYSSGHPFNLLLGFDANNDTQANTDRPPFVGRNTGIGPNYFNVDLRLAKEVRFRGDSDYRIEGIIEAFNLFNRVNFSGVNNTVGSCEPAGSLIFRSCGGVPLDNAHIKARQNASPAEPLGFTSAFDPRQIQLGVKFRF